ncbi:unnamed protein product [Staurois parvus]|uniref:Uncharacterized protein n=1 Tax=Staurois parvus TaxID=386267 RepID=A0ABN9D6B7_9NEOB|nr:unnamed protein product [Staurois parvus]
MRGDVLNFPPIHCLCTLPGSLRHCERCPLCPLDTVEHRSLYGSSDWPISDHMQSSKQDVTSDIIAYYVRNL